MGKIKSTIIKLKLQFNKLTDVLLWTLFYPYNSLYKKIVWKEIYSLA